MNSSRRSEKNDRIEKQIISPPITLTKMEGGDSGSAEE